MSGLCRLVVVLAMVLCAFPAEAHRLRVFAIVEDGTIRGHAFFVGGGRPAGARVAILDDTTVLHEMRTVAAGGFRWRAPVNGPITVRVDTGDGHGASGLVGAVPAPETAPAPRARLDPAIEAAIEAAVARQTAPLVEAMLANDARLRFNDVVGGVGMIVGLAGIALWATVRARGKERRP